MTSLGFGTKAATLEMLAGRLASATVLPLHYFCVSEWKKSKKEVCRQIFSASWGQGALVVRSSSRREDGKNESLAGRFLSLLNVSGKRALETAVDQVIASYGSDVDDDDEVLIQPMLIETERSGVAFSVDPATEAPYVVIEWSEGSDTGAVTSGRDARTYFRAKSTASAPPKELAGVVTVLEELERLFPGQPIDIEFAVIKGEVMLLQARRLVMRGDQSPEESQTQSLIEIAKKVQRGMTRHPFLHGSRTIYGVMPDWNPAEIIGVRPRALALSLYQDLITNSVWAYQRNNYGYKNLRSHPLMIDFCGLPYIDARVTFNSFIPRDIDDLLADRLADHYLDFLAAHPEAHDKVEFDVLFTCYSFDLPKRIKRLENVGFSGADCGTIVDSLRQLTNRIINSQTGLWRSDAARIDTLAARRHRLYQADTDPVTRIYWLLEDCKRYGTLPFAGLARAGFVAVELLRSLVAEGVLSPAERDRFINGLDAVSSQLPRDFANLDRSTFLSKYGHLRPGTYDILSPRYDEAADLYFDWNDRARVGESKETFMLSLKQMRMVAELLENHGLEHDVIGLFDFLQAGITLRESSKFEFTRNLSDVLALIGDFGAHYGFSRDDLSYLNIEAIFELYRSSAEPKSVLERSIEVGRQRYAQSSRIVLPPLIFSPEDVWSFEMPTTVPNFVTQKRVSAEVADGSTIKNLKGRILCIPSADLGYDWVFAHGIAGLVTAYGGANSHMAIRANELGLPAVIGAGEIKFQQWSSARRLDIDCANRKVEFVP